MKRLAAVALLVLACKSERSSAPPDDGGPGYRETTPPGEVPAASKDLPALADAMPLGAEMWRRFGKGEWTAHTFFVPDVKAHAVTIVVDMEGGGKDVADPFELVVEPQGLTIVEGEPRIDGRVPPGMKRRATWKMTSAQPGIAKIRFTTVKGGEEKGGTVACLKLSDESIYRCTESEANDPAPADTTLRGTYCCASSRNGAGEGCEPIGNVVDAIEACMKAKKHTLTCDDGVTCTGTTCRCR